MTFYNFDDQLSKKVFVETNKPEIVDHNREMKIKIRVQWFTNQDLNLNS